MVADKDIPSFDDIIQADRQRRKNEALANEIFGKGRRSSTPNATSKRKPGAGPSLASRVGIAKASQRSVSSTPKTDSNLERSWRHDLHPVNIPQASRVSRVPQEHSNTQITRINRLYDAVNAGPLRNGLSNQAGRGAIGKGIIIRGLAGPYVVMGSNFAPGTTSADIESAMTPVGGEMQSCRVLTSSPTVIAEMVFADKGGAENVITTFNNQKADGRLLHLYMKSGPPAPISAATPVPPLDAPTEPRAARPDLIRAEPSYDRQRELMDRNRRRAEPELQDGSYGFEARGDSMDIEVETNNRREVRRDIRHEDHRVDVGRGMDYGRGRDDRGLYSDDLYPRRGRGFRS